MCAGAATTTVYANTAADDTAYILGDSECRIVFAENDEQLAKLAQRRRDLPDLTQVVLVDGAAVLRQRSARHAAPPAADLRADHVHDAQALVTHHRLADGPVHRGLRVRRTVDAYENSLVCVIGGHDFSCLS